MNELKKVEELHSPARSRADHGEDPRRELVQRVSASAGFRKAARVREFLLYVCARVLDQHTDEITEQQIGTHVFGRPSGYNPGDDNVVRAQARVLRIKLEQYFTGEEGHAEPILITIPKGAYVPVFEPRPVAVPSPVSPAVKRFSSA